MMILQARLADVIDSSALQEGDTVIDLTAEGDFQVGTQPKKDRQGWRRRPST